MSPGRPTVPVPARLARGLVSASSADLRAEEKARAARAALAARLAQAHADGYSVRQLALAIERNPNQVYALIREAKS